MNLRLKLICTFFTFCLLFLFFFAKLSFADSAWNIYKITSGDVVPSSLRLQSGNNGFGLVWVDSRPNFANIYFVPIKTLGNRFIRVGKEVKLTYDDRDETPSLVWNGQDYALFWSHGRSQIYFARFNENGKKIIENKSLGVQSRGYAIHVSAVWNGEEYGVTWWDVRDAPICDPSGTRGRAFFARVNVNGEMIGEEIPVSSAFSNPWQDYHPLMVWDGENYVIFWGDSRGGGECTGGVGDSEIFMSKVNKNGEKILGDIKLQSNELSPQLWDVGWDGENYIIGYNGRIGQGDIAKMDVNGNTILVDIPINSTGQGGSPMITSYDNKYYISWGDSRNRTPETFYNEIYYTITERDGSKLIPETRLTYQDDIQGNTKIIANNKTMGLAWLGYKSGSLQVYFASNLANYPKLSLPEKPPKPSISILRPTRPLH